MNSMNPEIDFRMFQGRRDAPARAAPPAAPDGQPPRFMVRSDYIVASFTYRCCVRQALANRTVGTP